MDRAKVDSTAVEEVGYDAERRWLDIRYTGGKLYRYFGVPPEAYRALLVADSIGAFVNTEIKGAYDYEAL
jgi:hypothetical protein